MPYGILVKNGAQENYYYYIYNLQGEIIKIVDQSGAVVVEYAYNAWGEILATRGTLASTLGQTNPIRYKGYYYDTETGFYYLNSRYYDPVVRRFVNADSVTGTGDTFLGHNLYAYCNNNPVNMSDNSGCAPKWAKNLVQDFVSTMAELWEFTSNAFEIEIGNCFGLKGEIDIDGIGADFQIVTYMPHATFSDEGIESYDYQADVGLTVDFLMFEFGPHYTEYDTKAPELTLYRINDTIDIITVGGCFYQGLEFSLSLDYKYVFETVVEIFE